MPTTVQQVEALPEGLATLESVNPKDNLIENNIEETLKGTLKEALKEAPKETPKVTEESEKSQVTKVDCESAAPTESISLASNVDLFETPKHVLNCASEKFEKNTFEVNIVKEKQVQTQQKCFILTVHDLGFDNLQFDDFINSKQMCGLRNRTIWLNVNLPGQEMDAAEMSIQKYPSMEELADELVTVLDYFKLPQVVLLGEGVGATICTQFAIKYPTRCYGLMCIEPKVSSATVIQSLKFKVQNFSFTRQQSIEKKEKKETEEKAAAVVESQAVNENESFHLQPVNNTTHEKFKNRNVKNLALFTESFLNRTNLIDNVSKLQCDTLVATNKNSTGYSESKKFYRAINESKKTNLTSLVNTPFIEIDSENTGRILENSTEQFATSVQYFLQGIGLLSAMPLKMSLIRQESLSSQVQPMSVDESAVVIETTKKTETPAPVADVADSVTETKNTEIPAVEATE